jgi:predicted amidohydrolase YtcJ
MRRLILKPLLLGLIGAVAAGAAAVVHAQQQIADVVLTNGKIITVDNRFTIAQAVAVKGDRFIAVGTNQDIAKFAGPNTRRIDLGGKAVIPGLIDAHAHLMRGAETWTTEARFDDVASRKEALEIVKAKAAQLGPGKFVYNLGGWAYDQFADNPTPLTRAELDAAAPNNPVYLQFSRCCAFMNSKAVELLGIDAIKQPWVERDAASKPTGRINDPGLGQVAAKIPDKPKDSYAVSSAQMIKDLNKAGLTTAGISGCPQEQKDSYKEMERKGELTFRFRCMVGPAVGGGGRGGDAAAALQRQVASIGQIKLFQGDSYIDDVMVGESLAYSDNMMQPHVSYTAEQSANWKALATEVAKHGMPLQQHATISESFPFFLDQIEAINKEYPIKNLRWALCHLDQISATDLDRMKKLGMWAAVRAIPPVMGQAFNRAHGDKSYDMPPLRMIQDSGIMWGFHTDTNEVNQYNPFYTLWFAVTGKMVGGKVVNHQTITREEALIAHTRSNSFFVMAEDDLGSIAPGKLADLVVMDRDYLSIPADQIKDIKPVMTFVGGKMAYGGATPARATK